MLMDIAKYLATVGFIGSLLTDKLSVAAGISIFAAVIVLVVISFYTIPHTTQERRQIIMTAFYIILAGVLLVALFALIVSYREDHPRKSS